MRIARLLTMATLVVLVARASPAQAAVVWVNPSFESGLSGWDRDVTSTSSVWSTQSYTPSDPAPATNVGAQYLRMTAPMRGTSGSDTGGTATTNVQVIGNDVISGWYRLSGVTGGSSVASLIVDLAQWDGTGWTSIDGAYTVKNTASAKNGWLQWSSDTLGAGLYQVGYQVSNSKSGTGTVFADFDNDIPTDNRTPEPTAMLMLSMGLVGGLIGKRRGKAHTS